jgi:hypothetical protein
VEDFEPFRKQVERLLDLVDEYGLSEKDRDKIHEATKGRPPARFDDGRAGDLAQRLSALLDEAEIDVPDQAQELRALVAERLRVSF